LCRLRWFGLSRRGNASVPPRFRRALPADAPSRGGTQPRCPAFSPQFRHKAPRPSLHRAGASLPAGGGQRRHPDMNSLFYIIGVVVVALLVINLIS